MGFLSATSAIIAAGITVPTLVLIYVLKLRRRRVLISSTLLWSRVTTDGRANTLFERLRRNLLLLLQLLLLASLLLALARPTLDSTAVPGRQIIVLLDHSASMNATDVTPTRLAVAKQLAIDLIENQRAEGHSTSGGAMIVGFAQHAQIIQPFTTNRSLLRRAIESIQPTDETTQLAPALRVIEPIAASRGGVENEDAPIVYVISDGRIADIAQLERLSLRMRYMKVGREGGNVAIVSLFGRRDPQQPNRVQVLAQLTNDGVKAVDVNLTLRIDGRVSRVVPMTIPPLLDGQPGEQAIRFEVDQTGTGLMELSCDYLDALLADNTAWLSLTPPQQLNVLLVTKENPFLARAIEAASVRRLVQMTPQTYEQEGLPGHRSSTFDLIVFDGYQPRAMPAVNTLFFDAAPPLEQVKLYPASGRGRAEQIVLDWSRHHPLMSHVTLDDLLMTQPSRLALPDRAVTLAVGSSGPLIAQVTEGSTRHVIVGFDLRQSNWPLQISFPVFVRNCIQWLGMANSSVDAMTVRPGQMLTLPDSGTGEPLRYDGPVATGPPFTRVGLYEAQQEVELPWARLGVSLLNEHESRIEPVDQITLGYRSDTPRQITASMIRREIWPWFAARSSGVIDS